MKNPVRSSHIIAGLITVLVGYTSTAVIVYQAALHSGASEQAIGSWFCVLGLAMGIGTIALSCRYKVPVVVAWSTPGAVMLLSLSDHFTLPEIIGACIMSSFLTLITGISGLFSRLVQYIRPSLASAILAGMLLHFGIDIFLSMQNQVVLVGTMFVLYCIFKPLTPRYVLLIILFVGIVISYEMGLLQTSLMEWHLPALAFQSPSFTVEAFFSISLPLYVIGMTAQSLPGFSNVAAHGYHLDSRPVLSFIGILNTILAPFGAFSVNIAAISASICLSKESDPDPSTRYMSAVITGAVYIICAVLGAAIVGLITVFPRELVMGIAGLALLGTLTTSLKTMVDDTAFMEPSCITFLVCASGVTIFGISASLLALIIGLVASRLMIPAQIKYQ